MVGGREGRGAGTDSRGACRGGNEQLGGETHAMAGGKPGCAPLAANWRCTWRVPLVPAANLTADHPPARAVCCLSPRCERAWSPSFRRFVAGRAPHLPPPRLESSRNTRSGALAPAGQQLAPALGTHTQREREPGHAPASLLAQRCRDLATAIDNRTRLGALGGQNKAMSRGEDGKQPSDPSVTVGVSSNPRIRNCNTHQSCLGF